MVITQKDIDNLTLGEIKRRIQKGIFDEVPIETLDELVGDFYREKWSAGEQW